MRLCKTSGFLLLFVSVALSLQGIKAGPQNVAGMGDIAVNSPDFRCRVTT